MSEDQKTCGECNGFGLCEEGECGAYHFGKSCVASDPLCFEQRVTEAIECDLSATLRHTEECLEVAEVNLKSSKREVADLIKSLKVEKDNVSRFGEALGIYKRDFKIVEKERDELLSLKNQFDYARRALVQVAKGTVYQHERYAQARLLDLESGKLQWHMVSNSHGNG